MAGKHGVSNKGEKKNTIFFLLIILIIIITAGVIYKNNILDNSDTNQVKNSINYTFSSLKKLNKEKVDEYLNYKALISSIDPMILQEEGETELEKDLFKNMSWKIVEVNIEGKNAKVTINMKNKNFKNVFTKWMKDIVNEKDKGTIVSNKIALEILKENIEKEQETVNVEKEIKIKQQGGKWILFVDENLKNVVFPGIEVVGTALNNSN